MPAPAFTAPLPLLPTRSTRATLSRCRFAPTRIAPRVIRAGPPDAPRDFDFEPLIAWPDVRLSAEDAGETSPLRGGPKPPRHPRGEKDPVRPAEFEDSDADADADTKDGDARRAGVAREEHELAKGALDALDNAGEAWSGAKEVAAESGRSGPVGGEEGRTETGRDVEAVRDVGAEAVQIGEKKAEEVKDEVVKEAGKVGEVIDGEVARAAEVIEDVAGKATDITAGAREKAEGSVKDAAAGVVETGSDVVEKAEDVATSAEKELGKAKEGTSVKMTPEQIEKAKATRAAAAKAAAEKAEKEKAKTEAILSKAGSFFTVLGEKTGVFELGKNVRAKAEVAVENTIKLADSEKPSQADKLKASGAGAAKSIVATVTKSWEETLLPKVKERLPDAYSGLSSKAFATATLGLFVAVALLPSLFSGPAKEKSAKKQLDSETAVLEKKLKRDRSAPSSYSSSSRSSAQQKVFPPEGKTPPLSKAPEISKPAPVTPKTAEPKPESLADSSKSATSITSATSPQKPVESTPPPPVIPKPQPPSELVKKADVTPALILSAVGKALGSNASVVSSASFESLSAEPTVVLEVSKAFHRLPEGDQRQIAEKALKATRPLGYEQVSFIEKETGIEVAHAGIDIDLEDEEQNLRAQLAATRRQGDKLASANTNQEAEIDSLRSRLDEERDEFAAKRLVLEQQIKNMQQENNGLVQDLAEAKEEISRMPDRLALEERTIEAEKKSEKLADTVEMLSRQLTVARNDEASAKQVEKESLEAAKQAEKVKTEALASVAGQIERAKDEANRKATQDIEEARRDAQAAVVASNKRVAEVEESMAVAQKESSRVLESTTRSYEQRLAEEEQAKTVEVKSIQDKYEAMLVDIQKKATAELDAFQKEADKRMDAAMKEANAKLNSLTKERDQAVKETAKVESRSEKDSMKAAKERDGLKAKIAKLEAKLKGDSNPQAAVETEAKQEVTTSN